MTEADAHFQLDEKFFFFHPPPRPPPQLTPRKSLSRIRIRKTQNDFAFEQMKRESKSISDRERVQ
jgi:hypothetical protein